MIVHDYTDRQETFQRKDKVYVFNVLIDDTDTFCIAAFLHIHVFTCFHQCIFMHIK